MFSYSKHLLGIFMKVAITILFLIPITLLSDNPTYKTNQDFIRGLALYQTNQLNKALPYFQKAVESESQNSELQAYLAETYRRLDRKPDAVIHAKKALRLHPCYSFALTCLADTYNPMFGKWEKAHFDTTWKYLQKAAECDSNDGNAWVGIWCEAIRRGNQSLEKSALQHFISSGFLTPSLLAYTRWVLRDLPRNAILLTNGDMDTYPAVALQEVENLRTDIAIVNLSLLNTPWYVRHIRDRYRIPLPFEDHEIDKLHPFKNKNNEIITISKLMVKVWMKMQNDKTLYNPIAIAPTVGNQHYPSNTEKHLIFFGPFLLWRSSPMGIVDEESTIQKSLLALNPNDFVGSLTSKQDRSPVRLNYTNLILKNISHAALYYTDLQIKSNNTEEAQKMLNWLEQFEKKTILGFTSDEQIKKFRIIIDKTNNWRFK